MTIDTGASTDTLDEAAFTTNTLSVPIELQNDSTQIFAYGSQSQLTVQSQN